MCKEHPPGNSRKYREYSFETTTRETNPQARRSVAIPRSIRYWSDRGTHLRVSRTQDSTLHFTSAATHFFQTRLGAFEMRYTLFAVNLAIQRCRDWLFSRFLSPNDLVTILHASADHTQSKLYYTVHIRYIHFEIPLPTQQPRPILRTIPTPQRAARARESSAFRANTYT